MTKTEAENKVNSIFTEKFTQYDVEDVPDIEDSRLTHGNTGFHGEFSFLYADMRGSSSFTDQHRLQTISKIYKAFHHCMVELIKDNNGKVRSFDGDRVLGVFGGKRKINNSVECAMKMICCAEDVLMPKIKSQFNNNNFDIGIGIATGNCMAIKAGVGFDKNNRDLVWIGDPPNLGAKLSDVAKTPYRIYIDDESFGRLLEANRYTKDANGNKIDMWTNDRIVFGTSNITVHKTSYYRHL